MPQIKVILQKEQINTGVTGTTNGTAVSLDGALTLAAQVVLSSVSSVAGASVVIQGSCDPTDTTPSNWNTLIASQSVTTNGVLLFQKVNPEVNWARLVLTTSSGSFSADTQIVVKGPN